MRVMMLIIACCVVLLAAVQAPASGINFNDTTAPVITSAASQTFSNPVLTGNTGIATTSAQAALIVLGNVGIGTWTAGGGNLIIRGGGNVGIASSRPGQALDVVGTLRAAGFIGDGSGLSNLATSVAGGANAVQYTTGSVAGDESKFSFNGSNVGINTTNGTALLDVRGNAVFSGNVGIGTTQVNAAALTVMSGNVGIGTWLAQSNLVLKYAISPSLSIYNIGAYNSNLGMASVAGHFTGYSYPGAWGFRANNGYLLLNPAAGSVVFGDGTAERMRFVSSTGNLGIGTVDPASPLVVVGNGVGIGTGANDNFLRTTAPSGGMVVRGNVGLGTVTPQAQLTVLGNAGIGTWTAAGGRLIVRSGNVGIGTGAPGARLETVGLGTANAASNALILRNADGLQYFTVLDNGNVGVGTTTAPDSTLLLYQKGGSSLISYSGVSNSYIGQLGGVGFLFTAQQTANANLGTNNTTQMRVLANGKVGLGTLVPQANVSVAGYINTSGTSPTLSSCGTGPSVAGSDMAFRFTGGATAVGCTATFATARTKTPVCVVIPEYATSTRSYTVTTTALTYTDAALGTNNVDVICIGQD